MRRLAFALLACCYTSSPPAPSTRPQPPPPTKSGPITYAYRILSDRAGGLTLESFQLTIEGARATLEMSGQSGPSAMPTDGCALDGKPVDCKEVFNAMWSEAVELTMTGTAAKQPTGFRIELLRERGPKLLVSCTEKDFEVAPPGAVVIQSPSCGPLSWSLPTERARLLACDDTSGVPMFLAPGPGIERVHLVTAGCGNRAPMFRRVAADRSIAPPFPP